MNIETIPKIELHIHLEGSLRPATIRHLARKNCIVLPSTDLEDIARQFLCGTNKEFFAVWDRVRPLLAEPEDFGYAAGAILGELAGQNTRYVELRMNPGSHSLRRDVPLEEAVESVLAAMDSAREDKGLRSGLIFGASREHGMEEALFVAEAALRFSDRGVVGFDFSGDEKTRSEKVDREVASALRGSGLKITVHAGEWDGPESARQALELLGPSRLGHGTRLFEDPGVIREIRSRGICMELNPTSNVMTEAISRIEDHPLPRYAEEGIPFVIGTDDPGIFGITLTGEYRLASEKFGLGKADFERIFHDGLEHAFGKAPDA